MDSNSVILTFYTIDGEKSNKKKVNTVHYAPFHLLGPFEPATIRTVEVGSNVALYGNIMKQVDGIYVSDYLHLRGGKYTYTLPFHWLTMHADLIYDNQAS